MNVTVIVAARLRSTRLPGKALLPLAGLPMLALLLRRLKASKLSQQIVLATTTRKEDNLLEQWARFEGVDVFRGSENNVAGRFVAAAEKFGGQYIARITADCPFIDGWMLDYCLEQAAQAAPFELATTKGAFPVGLDVEIYRTDALKELHNMAMLSEAEREHVTLKFYENEDKFRVVRLFPPVDMSGVGLELTVDTAEDYLFARSLIKDGDDPMLSVKQIVARARSVFSKSVAAVESGSEGHEHRVQLKPQSST